MPIPLCSGPLDAVDEQIVDKARKFADEHLKPHAEHWEQTRHQPEKTLRMAISEFAGIRIQRENQRSVTDCQNQSGLRPINDITCRQLGRSGL